MQKRPRFDQAHCIIGVAQGDAQVRQRPKAGRRRHDKADKDRRLGGVIASVNHVRTLAAGS
jgi:hypothetical protein